MTRESRLAAASTASSRSVAAASDVLAAALRLAAGGRPVFPCDPASKRPLTRHGFKDASTDPAQVRRWFDRQSAPMIGLVTGQVSGLVVVDADEPDGHDSLHSLEREHGPLPLTASVKTPSGGQHYYFAWPGEAVPCSAGRLGPGLDVRADGGYVIAPPSRNAAGRRYEVDEQAPVAELPPWLARLIVAPADGERRPPTPPGEWLRIARGVPAGSRHASLARLSGYLLARDVDARLTAELIAAVAARCRPPLPESEARRIVESIAERELRRRRGRRP